ncbi:MAG: hypothetical protein K2W95_24355 [Candidatus Obscuribacterales bacterium]|nr:hypothetical protein [Candidatus Obscuribacterales bacterium]
MGNAAPDEDELSPPVGPFIISLRLPDNSFACAGRSQVMCGVEKSFANFYRYIEIALWQVWETELTLSDRDFDVALAKSVSTAAILKGQFFI